MEAEGFSWVLAAAPVIVFTAHFVFGVTGFGSSVIAVPLLAHFLPLTFVVPLMALLDLVASMLVGGRSRHHVNAAEIRWLVPPALLGIVAGVTLLVRVPPEPLLAALGVFVLAVGVRSLTTPERGAPVARRWALPVGLVGGAFGAVFGTGGPIYATYLSRRLEDKAQLRATMSTMVILSTMLRTGIFLVAGLLLNAKLLLAAVLLAPAMLAGVRLGTRVHLGMSLRRAQQAVAAVLILSGTSLLVRTVA